MCRLNKIDRFIDLLLCVAFSAKNQNRRKLKLKPKENGFNVWKFMTNGNRSEAFDVMKFCSLDFDCLQSCFGTSIVTRQ